MKPMVVFLQLAMSFTSAFALQAPTLNEVSVDAGNKATLKWRNNVFESAGNIISRLTVGETAWIAVDTVGKSIDTFKDPGVKGGPRVCYKVSVLDPAGNQDASDSLCADSKKIFLPVKIDYLGYNTASHANVLHFEDLSNSEKGYRIYRGRTFDSLTLIGELSTGDSLISGPLTYTDSKNLGEFEYYSYQVEIYNDSQSLKTSVSRIFTFNFRTLVKSRPHLIKLGAKLGRTPIKYQVDLPMLPESWALKSGDSMLVRESDSPDSSYSLLDISDPKAPVFKGYRRPGFSLPMNGFTRGNKFFGIKWLRQSVGVLQYLQFANGDFRIIDQDTLVIRNLYSFSFYKDSVLSMESDCMFDTTLVNPPPSLCLSFYSVTDTSMKLDYRNPSPLSARGVRFRNGRTMLAPYDLSLAGSVLTIDDYRFQGPRRFSLTIDSNFSLGLNWPIPIATEPDYLIEGSVEDLRDPTNSSVPVTIHLDTLKRLAYIFYVGEMGVWEYSESDGSTGIRFQTKDQGIKRKHISPRVPEAILGYDILGRQIRWGGSLPERPTREPMLIFPVR